ncbi:MAG: phytoene/squalene synthase family protein [Planctomycetes bacterium]|nr:phytoene/squalene synthase family protein [Planctomycetota bacterium]
MAASRSYCERTTREAAKNFYYGLRLLPEPKRSSMYALYSFMRVIDDIVDEEAGRPKEHREADLHRMRAATQAALATGVCPDDRPFWPAFLDMVRRHEVPHRIFEDAIDGQARDLSTAPFADFPALEHYCYLVAGTVGLASVYVFGFTGGQDVEALAIKRGLAFQLTNILRDLREDAGRGRVYLPENEIRAAGLTAADLTGANQSPALIEFLHAQSRRAESFYEQSAPLESHIEPDARPTLRAMTDIYHGILDQIRANPARVLRERVSLSLLAKLRIGWRAARSR